MQSAKISERRAFINDILSVINNAEKASFRAIKEFKPYINEKGRALPFLCKTADDFSMPANANEYQIFLSNLDKRLYPSYFTTKMDFSKAISEICNCIASGNYVADDYTRFAITQYENDVDNKRFAETLSEGIGKIKSKPDFTSITRTRGDSSYYAYLIYLTLKKRVGLRSPTL